MSSAQIPLVDLRTQFLELKPEIMAAFAEVLDEMQLFLGPHLQSFERNFAAFCGCREAVGVSSGTDALALALRACGIGAGDEVITVANTFIATVEAIARVGATPVFVDIDPATYLMDCDLLEQVLTPHTRALLPVHLYGHSVEMRPLLTFAQQHHLRVIEDASQAHGASYYGQPVGSFGDIGCFSLYYSKNLGALGEAGICTTNDPELAERLRTLRDHGSRKRYHHEMLGENARLDELQAAVLDLKLPHLKRWNSARQHHADLYTAALQDRVEAVPVVRSDCSHVYCYYVIQVAERERFCQEMADASVATGIHYPVPIHLQPACTCYGYRQGSLPITEAAATRIVSLPMYPELNEEQVERIVKAVWRASRVVA